MPADPPGTKVHSGPGSLRQAAGADVRWTNRVSETQHQARAGLRLAAAFAVSAVVAAIVPQPTGRWMPLHLFLVGAVLGAISAVAPLLAVTWSASRAPRRSVAAAQRWLLATGATLVVVGREREAPVVVGVGGALVVAALLVTELVLIAVARSAKNERFRPAIEAYVAALVAGSVGVALGTALAVGWLDHVWAQARDAHLTLNLFGLVGLVVAGTLPYFAATQVRRPMTPHATPRMLRGVISMLVAAAAVATWGRYTDARWLAASGYALHAAGMITIAALLPAYGRRQLRWAGPRMIQLLTGVGWWVAATVGLAVVTVQQTDDRRWLLVLVVGGLAQILVASVAYLAPVLRGGGHERLTAGFTATRSWASVAAGNVAAIAAVVGSDVLLATALAVWSVVLAARASLMLLPGRPARPTGSSPDALRSRFSANATEDRDRGE